MAIARAQFETIHPFTDGNGRTGRALVQAMLPAPVADSGVIVEFTDRNRNRAWRAPQILSALDEFAERNGRRNLADCTKRGCGLTLFACTSAPTSSDIGLDERSTLIE